MKKINLRIAELRHKKKITQQELADIVGVSFQTISKWENGGAMPDITYLPILAEYFGVSVDQLMGIVPLNEVHSCGDNALCEKKPEIYEGVLIKESVTDDSIIDLLKVHKIELWNTGGTPKYWTVLFFTSDKKDFPERISRVLLVDPDRGGNWFVDFKAGNEKYIVFKDKVLKYQIGNQTEKDRVQEECRKLGISEKEMNWSE